MVYVGMDVHRKRSQVAIVDDFGAEVLNRNLRNDPAELMPVLGTLEPGTAVAFEAAYGWAWVNELLEDLGLEPHLAHAFACKAIAAARLKNDKVDARTLAHLLRADLLPEAWIAPPEVRELRALLRHRATLVRLRTRAQARVHAVLADRGLHPGVGLWTAAGTEWLDRLDLSGPDRTIVTDNRAVITFATSHIAPLEKTLRERAKGDPRINALRQLPGIGEITSLTVVAEVGDISRFPSARKLCAWAGLTPAVKNSDRKVRHGHITKQGSVWLRSVLVEAAHVAIRRPPFSATYTRIARRRGNNIAMVAVARKLLARCYHKLAELET
jgi:transposase